MDLRRPLLGRQTVQRVSALGLKRQVALADKAGYRPMAGVEPEFIVLKYDDDGRPVKAFDDDPTLPQRQQAAAPSLGLRPGSIHRLNGVPRRADRHPERARNGTCTTWSRKAPIRSSSSTSATPNVVEMADRLTFLRILLKEVAKKQGLFVTFMPKPTHRRLALRAPTSISRCRTQRRRRKNLFGGSRTRAGRREAYHAVGGLLQHGGVHRGPDLLDGQFLQRAWSPAFRASRAASTPGRRPM